jgi:CubicO group peptidase (beta-lactamase class C family)
VTTNSCRGPSRSTTASVLIFVLLLLSGAGSSPVQADEPAEAGRFRPPTAYRAAILEARTAALDVLKDGRVSALTIALVARDGIIWSQAFGLADREAGQAATARTMFGIGSVSKMLATTAVMKLVEKGLIDLDRALVEYLPDFRMASPEYRKITVRMLLNHSSGFPGTDYRNGETTAPFPGYLDQVLRSLSIERLKAPPGYMSVYCNDGFTLIEALVAAMTGRSFVEFVQDEILTPLGMENTRYPLAPFPDGSHAKTYRNGTVQPLNFGNLLATGGAYSTASDVGRLAMMFLGGGVVGRTRILSEASVAEMAVDQTIGTYNPVRADWVAFGLGWDTVTEPGLRAVGFDGWNKGGDITGYGTAIIVSPRAQLAAVVIGASLPVAPGFGSVDATTIAQRMLLRALAEDRSIPAFPAPLPAVVPPVQSIPDGLLASIAGEYASFNTVIRVQAQADGSLLLFTLSDDGWTPLPDPLKYRGAGWFSADQTPLRSFTVIEAAGTQYLVLRRPGGYGHYLDHELVAQRVRGTGNLSAAWRARLSKTWLLVNEAGNSALWPTLDPRLRLATAPELTGLVAVRGPWDPGFSIVDPSASDAVATMMLVVPQLAGRDLNDLDVVRQDGVEWMRFGSYVHRPLDAVPTLPSGATSTVTIGPDGYAEWRAVATPVEVDIDTTGAWRIYDSAFASVASGTGASRAVLSSVSGLAYIILFGDPAQTMTVTLSPARSGRDVPSNR